MPVDDHAIRTAADLIQRYLADHPDAADTAEGMRVWWFSGVSAAAIEAALADLVRRGVVRRQEVPGGPPVYSRALPR
jgi:hypothetical protein